MDNYLDREIEQLERIVEACMANCLATRDGQRCTLPPFHEETDPHHFPGDPVNK